MPILSAGIIPVRRENGSWLVLLLRAYRYWDFPKGIVHPSEDPWDAALRELREETGIKHVAPQWGRSYYQTPPYLNNRKIARYYLAEVFNSKVELRATQELGRPEHHEYRWLNHAQAHALLVPRVQQANDWAFSRLHQSDI